MATVSMKRLTLVGLSSERAAMLKAIHRLRCVEIAGAGVLENTKEYSDADAKDKLNGRLARITYAFSLLKEASAQAVKLKNKYTELLKDPEKSNSLTETNKAFTEYAPEKKPFMLGLPGVKYEDFEDITGKAAGIFDVIDNLERLNSLLTEIKSASARAKSLYDQLEPYLEIDARFSDFKDTKNAAIMLGLVPANKVSVIEILRGAFPEAFFAVYAGNKYAAVATVCHITAKAEITGRLVEADYAPCNFTFASTAAEKRALSEAELSELEIKRESILEEMTHAEKYSKDLKTLYDYYLLELRKAEADNKFRFTDSTFVMECWYPAETEAKVLSALNEFTVDVETFTPSEGDTVPTLLKNNSIVSPYEEITNLYSVPSYLERDPNPFVAFFYFMYFGIMVSDAGYGLIIAIGAFLMYKLAKPRKGEGKLVLVIAMGGISTFIWGAMFGGWFGAEIFHPILFNPMENPLAMLGLSLGLGFINIMFGMGLKAAEMFKQGKILDPICNIFGWYGLFLGLGIFALNSALWKIGWLKTVGVVILLAGLAGIIIGGGLGKKGIIKKLLGGFANIYSITGFLSDILSYSRLFGLGLATGVIGMVINQLAGVAIELIPLGIGYVIAIPIYIGGHIFNLGINTLGAYVHDSRLQYIEFFSRFYNGGGHQFIPFGTNTKYIYIEN